MTAPIDAALARICDSSPAERWITSPHVTETLARYRAEDEANALPESWVAMDDAREALARAERDLSDARLSHAVKAADYDRARTRYVEVRDRESHLSWAGAA